MNTGTSGDTLTGIENRLWEAADNLRANSNFASNEYFLPVMGLVFLRHAYSRYLAVKDNIEANLPSRGGVTRALTKEDFSQRSAIFLQPKAQFDSLVALPDSEDRAKALIEAMDSIEDDYDNLKSVLPKNEYQELDNDVLGQLLRTLNPDELKRASGDVFGRIYEYFLTKFADDKAHDGGEFFTPVSLVSFIAHVLNPQRGTVLDPACGSGGMFVQSARTVEEGGESPTDRLTFRGLEKNATTIRLAKMNLAVHGLEGDIQKAITYYEDPHELVGKADFVMANPPFNVDEIDADKVKTDLRLPFGLPGVNKKDKVSNGNYVWISYFYSYLNEHGRAGFVMSSQASSAGGGEAKVRQKLIETGDVDIMVAVRQNFFYTRTVPCELWFLNRDKPEKYNDKVLMIDARNVYRQVTRKIYDFSPEQQQNLQSIVWLYRGETDRYIDLVTSYCQRTLSEAARCFSGNNQLGRSVRPLPDFVSVLDGLTETLQPFLDTLSGDVTVTQQKHEAVEARNAFIADIELFQMTVSEQNASWTQQTFAGIDLKQIVDRLSGLSESSHSLVKRADKLLKLVLGLIETCENDFGAKRSSVWVARDITRDRKSIDTARQKAVEQLKQVRYFWMQAEWLTERFPDAELRDVEGLVKLVDHAELETNDWSLTPGRYVGIAPEEEDPDFNFDETLRSIHVELEALNLKATSLGMTIKQNFEELGA
ncbi:N-6 DNA methylase [Dehalococcoides mccartyi]|nr:N-6 DNA methylase [Dehalococcoides mccartyi]